MAKWLIVSREPKPELLEYIEQHGDLAIQVAAPSDNFTEHADAEYVIYYSTDQCSASLPLALAAKLIPLFTLSKAILAANMECTFACITSVLGIAAVGPPGITAAAASVVGFMDAIMYEMEVVGSRSVMVDESVSVAGLWQLLHEEELPLRECGASKEALQIQLRGNAEELEDWRYLFEDASNKKGKKTKEEEEEEEEDEDDVLLDKTV